MKKAFLSGCVLGLSLSLAACGGGGGGGNSHSGFSDSTFNVSDMSRGAKTRNAPKMGNAAETAGALVSPGSDLQSALAGSGINAGDYSNYTLKAGAGSVTLLESGAPIATFDSGKMKFYTKDGIDFAVFSDVQKRISEEEFVNGNHVTISATPKNVVWLGKLDYASFGYWAMLYENMHIQIDGSSYNIGTSTYDNETFYDGRKADYVSLDNSQFTGIAAGTAEFTEYEAGANSIGFKAVAIPLLGTADLRITNASNATLTLNFPNFYELKGSVSITSPGSISGYFDQAKKSGSATPVVLDTYYNFNNRISGQLYGNTPSTPTEAAGNWYLRIDTVENDEITIEGAWGVKKKP